MKHKRTRLNNVQMEQTGKRMDCMFTYVNMGQKFFYITMVFGYLAGPVKQRKFLA